MWQVNQCHMSFMKSCLFTSKCWLKVWNTIILSPKMRIINLIKYVGICIPVLTCLGLLGNIASIIVLRSPGLDMKVSFIFSFWCLFPHLTLCQITFRQILMMLAMFDSMFIICMTVSFSLPKLIPAYRYCLANLEFVEYYNIILILKYFAKSALEIL